jgi:hypothetical protein
VTRDATSLAGAPPPKTELEILANAASPAIQGQNLLFMLLLSDIVFSPKAA